MMSRGKNLSMEILIMGLLTTKVFVAKRSIRPILCAGDASDPSSRQKSDAVHLLRKRTTATLVQVDET